MNATVPLSQSPNRYSDYRNAKKAFQDSLVLLEQFLTSPNFTSLVYNLSQKGVFSLPGSGKERLRGKAHQVPRPLLKGGLICKIQINLLTKQLFSVKSFYKHRIRSNRIKMTDHSQELLTFFKAMSDANRLKIIGLLAQKSFTVEQLAAMLGLGESTVSHHLSKLSEAGLVTATAQSYYNNYHLEYERIQEAAQLLLSPETLPAMVTNVDANAFERKVVSDYLLPNGRLKTIPSQRKKLLAVLHHLVQNFQQGKRYTEKEVNQILGRFHEDTASLRRELIGYRLMARESDGGSYWRLETIEE
jgi:predicted transcriptional regulator